MSMLCLNVCRLCVPNIISLKNCTSWKLARLLDTAVTASKFALFSVSGLKDEKLIKGRRTWKLKHTKTPFLSNVIEIDPYHFELYRFKVGAFFSQRQCNFLPTDSTCAGCWRGGGIPSWNSYLLTSSTRTALWTIQRVFRDQLNAVDSFSVAGMHRRASVISQWRPAADAARSDAACTVASYAAINTERKL